MKKTFIPAIAGLLASLLLLGGMGIYFRVNTRQIDLQEAGGQEKYERHYVLIAGDGKSELWQSVYESAKQRAEESGAYLEPLDAGQMEEYSLADYMKISIAARVDGIIMQPDGSEEIRGLIKEAWEEEIPVVTVLEDDSDSARISFVGINNYQLGNAYGDAAVNRLKKDHTNIMVLCDANREDTGSNLVISQITNRVRETLPEDKTVDVSTYRMNMSQKFETEEAIRDIFVNKEEVPDMLICLDEVITQCAYQAVVDYNQVGNTDIIGYYTTRDTLTAIRRGIVSASISFSTAQIGTCSVDALNEYLTLGHVSNYFNVDITTVNQKNALLIAGEEEVQGEG